MHNTACRPVKSRPDKPLTTSASQHKVQLLQQLLLLRPTILCLLRKLIRVLMF